MPVPARGGDVVGGETGNQQQFRGASFRLRPVRVHGLRSYDRCVTTLTERSRVRGTVISEVVTRSKGLGHPAGNPGREPRRESRPRGADTRRRCRRPPAGPRAAVRLQPRSGAAVNARADVRCPNMKTINKVRKQLERSALKGWRMRYYMQ